MPLLYGCKYLGFTIIMIHIKILTVQDSRNVDFGYFISVDCAVAEWNVWGPCTKNGQHCGYKYGLQNRRRETIQKPSPDGLACPALTEYRACKLEYRYCSGEFNRPPQILFSLLANNLLSWTCGVGSCHCHWRHHRVLSTIFTIFPASSQKRLHIFVSKLAWSFL